MKRRVANLSMALLVLLSSGCNRHGRLRVLPITHVAVGRSATLIAYEEERSIRSNSSAQAASHNMIRRLVAAKWNVSDASIASVSNDGTLTGLEAGRVNIRGAWEGQEIVTVVEVVSRLPFAFLPQLATEEMRSSINEVKLNLAPDRTLRFHVGFYDSQEDITVEAKAPEQQLPWTFRFDRGMVELTNAAGRTVSGELRLNTGGKASFTVWSDDSGIYPVSLKDKTVLLLGDSMAEGLGWFLRGKIEAAGGRYVIAPWQSSTISGWESGRLKKVLERHKPDILFISLGSNELFIKDPEQTRAPQIRQLTKDLGDLPAYWIGPPSWKPDNGLIRVIRENFQPDHFYDSNDLKVPRRGDGAHPTREGFETWANSVWDWYARIG
jgi:lysophospholipase L1-like esterase